PAAAPLARRAAAAVERPPRRYEHHRPEANAPLPGGALHATPTAAAGSKAGHYRLGAGARPRQGPMGGADRARRLVRRAPLALPRPADPRQNPGGALQRNVQGCYGRLEGVGSTL